MTLLYAWFAGFFEGEGCVRFGSKVHKNGKDYGVPVINICQVNKEPLDRCLVLFPNAKIYGPYKYGSNKQYHYNLAILGRDNVEHVYDCIAEFLSVKRKEQFQQAFGQHDQLIATRELQKERA